jgi:hypothetical protein
MIGLHRMRTCFKSIMSSYSEKTNGRGYPHERKLLFELDVLFTIHIAIPHSSRTEKALFCRDQRMIHVCLSFQTTRLNKTSPTRQHRTKQTHLLLLHFLLPHYHPF